MDWINCNVCCRQPGDEKDRMFMLSSCGHIYCDLCLAQAESRDKCKVCSAQCQLIQLSSKMKPDAEIFFQEPAELLKKQNMQMNRLLEFQKEHRIRLVSFHRKVLVKYKELERKYRLATERMQQLEKENSKLKEIVTSGVGGGGEYGVMGGSVTPHDSYQRAINASAMRNSPQGTPMHHISPSGTRISPGRLTLLKGKPATTQSRVSPNLSPNETRLKTNQREAGRHPSPHTQMRGGPVYHQTHETPITDINTGMSMYQIHELSRIPSPLINVANGSYYQNGGTMVQPQTSQQLTQTPFMPHSQGKKIIQPEMQGNQFPYPARPPNPMLASQEIPISRSFNPTSLRQMPMPYSKY